MDSPALARWLRTYQSLPTPEVWVELSSGSGAGAGSGAGSGAGTGEGGGTFAVVLGAGGPRLGRSMGDFVALRHALTGRFPGAAVPPLPEGHAGDFVKDRKRLTRKAGDVLTYWIRAVARHPFLSQDEAFVTFLAPVNSFKDALDNIPPPPTARGAVVAKRSSSFKFLGALRRQSSAAAEGPPTQSVTSTSPPGGGGSGDDAAEAPKSAMDFWTLALELSPNPLQQPGNSSAAVSADRQARDVLAEMEHTEKLIHHVKEGVRVLVERLETVATAHVDVARHISSWLTLEYVPAAATAASPAASDIPAILTESSRAHQVSASKLLDLATDVTRLTGGIRFEILVLRGLKHQVTETIAKLDALAKAERRLDAKATELAQAEATARAERKEATDHFSHQDVHDEIFDKRTRVQRKARDDALEARDAAFVVASRLCKCVLNIERELYRAERVVRIQQLFRDLAHVQTKFAVAFRGVWDDEFVTAPPLPQAGSEVHGSMPRSSSLASSEAALKKSGVLVVAAEPPPAPAPAPPPPPPPPPVPAAAAAAQDQDDDALSTQSSSPSYEPWDTSQSWEVSDVRPVRVAFDFDAEEPDELTVREGDEGIAGPFDVDRNWLLVKTEHGEGLVPTEFVVCRRSGSGPPPAGAETTALVQQLRTDLQAALHTSDELRRDLAIARKALEDAEAEKAALAQELDACRLELSQAKKAAEVPAAAPAAAPAPAPHHALPPVEGWIVAFDPRYNRHFYFNPVTKQSLWKVPHTQGQSKRKGGPGGGGDGDGDGDGQQR